MDPKGLGKAITIYYDYNHISTVNCEYVHSSNIHYCEPVSMGLGKPLNRKGIRSSHNDRSWFDGDEIISSPGAQGASTSLGAHVA